MADSRPLRLLVAADKFKGSLSGPEACQAIAEGLKEALGDRVEINTAPVADGGEGMARGITEARGGEWQVVTVLDPLGRPVEAGFGLIEGDSGETVGVIEMAEASGLWRLADSERDPWRASTFGTGELMRAAITRGADRLLLGIGGSATNDGGSGMAAALGFQFLSSEGDLLTDLPADLEKAVSLELSPHPLVPVEVACDVTNPLLGPTGCTTIYGPQKGVSEGDHERHESRLAHLVALLGHEKGARAAKVPGSGAAGGLGFGCLAFLNAELRPGFDLVAEVLGLEAAVRDADIVITGEGKLDGQTLQGKAPAGVAKLARRFGKPVTALAGIIADDAGSSLAEQFDF
ncbi:MAG: glycerate kinase, partial [Verrucomicrobiae bacterium]|nr:glycerate kinase [Verrucomicrobiae bacterium]